ncbi:MAG TPA: hypothetical protein VIH27_07165 [Nitrososphaerales archaeon]
MAKKYAVNLTNIVSIDDSTSDRCTIENAGIEIWFTPVKDREIGHVIRVKNLNLIISILKK